jgi:hypothetical protein
MFGNIVNMSIGMMGQCQAIVVPVGEMEAGRAG